MLCRILFCSKLFLSVECTDQGTRGTHDLLVSNALGRPLPVTKNAKKVHLTLLNYVPKGGVQSMQWFLYIIIMRNAEGVAHQLDILNKALLSCLDVL